MKELVELRLDDNRLVLKDHLVRTPILPKVHAEMDRDVVIMGETVVEGAVYARSLQVQAGPLDIHGPVFTQNEVHIVPDFKGDVLFRKTVGSAGGVASRGAGARAYFGADINAKQVNLRNAYVAASIFAQEITLDNCVVLGGVFATRELAINNGVVGTFNSPSVRLSQNIYALLPSVFSVEPIACLPGTTVRNLSLADLGSLMRGGVQSPRSGFITMDPASEQQRIVLTDEQGNMQVVRSLTVAGKVLAADLIDLDKLQNHFILSAGSLGAQLLKTYDLVSDDGSTKIPLTPQRIAAFFTDILSGKIEVQPMQGHVSLKELMDA
jgi:hypothetical protein